MPYLHLSRTTAMSNSVILLHLDGQRIHVNTVIWQLGKRQQWELEL